MMGVAPGDPDRWKVAELHHLSHRMLPAMVTAAEPRHSMEMARVD